ncbi:MAG: OmpH family outer membrane protein [Verrucomicrobia bacterium]|jgi:outer membrane protein|nr:MAG: OmpH family outer membrane protein [Verrucomicrobiota bacterium]
MKKFIRTALLATLLLMGGGSLANAQVKFGTVDMNRVFSEYYKTKNAQAKYAEAEKAANDDLNGRVDTLKKSMQEISAINSDLEKTDLSKEARDAKLKDQQTKVAAARSMDREIADFRSAKQKTLQDQFLRMRKDIVDDIMKTVNDLVKAKGYDIVFDKSGLSAGAVPVVLFSRDDLDFSQDVITALNKNAPVSK